MNDRVVSMYDKNIDDMSLDEKEEYSERFFGMPLDELEAELKNTSVEYDEKTKKFIKTL